MEVKDYRQRFVFNELDARGCLVHLQETCKSIQATHHYPSSLAKLLNEFALAATLLRDSIKVDGSLTVQLRTKGAIKLVMADCLSDRRVRAIAEFESNELVSNHTIALNELGQGAVLAITITPDAGERYQSIVPIEQPTLALCLEDYFERSEQLPSSFRFFSDQQSALGIALHALPSQKVSDPEQTRENFNRLQALLSTLSEGEALTLSSEEMLTRLFHEESCELFDKHSVEFGCNCSANKSLDAIRSLGKDDVADLLTERKANGDTSLVVDCHFCFQRYDFSFEKIGRLFN